MEYGTLTYTIKGSPPQTFTLRLGSVALGREHGNDIVLDDASVSLYHARLLCTPTECWIEDLESTNGTFLNHVRLQPNVRQPLRNGDTLRLGSVVIQYRRTDQGAQPLERAVGSEQPQTPRAVSQRPPVLPPEVAARLPQSIGSPSAAHTVPVRRLRGNGGPPRIKPGTRRLAYSMSSYLQYLPVCYQDDDFLGHFLLIFESILDPIERTIDQIDHYFDPYLAPEPLLPWLASWVDLVLNENWPVERRRTLIGRAAELYRWRGTRRGLSEYIRIYTGVEPTIFEPGDGGNNRQSSLEPHVFRVILDVPDPKQVPREIVEAIIEAEKPAHTGYILEIRQAVATKP
jgi:phage tail-like protein